MSPRWEWKEEGKEGRKAKGDEVEGEEGKEGKMQWLGKEEKEE